MTKQLEAGAPFCMQLSGPAVVRPPAGPTVVWEILLLAGLLARHVALGLLNQALQHARYNLLLQILQQYTPLHFFTSFALIQVSLYPHYTRKPGWNNGLGYTDFSRPTEKMPKTKRNVIPTFLLAASVFPWLCGLVGITWESV